MWIINERGEQVFAQGQSAWAAAAQQANLCPAFKADDEDEWVADQAISSNISMSSKKLGYKSLEVHNNASGISIEEGCPHLDIPLGKA